MEDKNKKKIIVFVCKGNIHRSAIAEQVLKRILKEEGLHAQFEIVSRGIKGSAGTVPTLHKNIVQYEDNWKYAKPSLDEFRIDITQHIARPITKEIVRSASVLITFDKVVLEEDGVALLRQFPEYKGKIHLLSELDGIAEDIPDCGDVKDSEFHRIVTKRIHDILTSHWKELIGWAS